ncbi:MAG: ATP-binding protein [Cyanophyceae cyanobacterium]
MIAISMSPKRREWSVMSFASTLYLCPVLDLLLADIPTQWQPELRLGLQEALVNAAKHGNKLDPSKTVVVQFSVTKEEYSWVISDEGTGFKCNGNSQLPREEAESGRGLCILYYVFDRVHWNQQGTELKLCKQLKGKERQPLLC